MKLSVDPSVRPGGPGAQFPGGIGRSELVPLLPLASGPDYMVIGVPGVGLAAATLDGAPAPLGGIDSLEEHLVRFG